jgi:hypothetical protein
MHLWIDARDGKSEIASLLAHPCASDALGSNLLAVRSMLTNAAPPSGDRLIRTAMELQRLHCCLPASRLQVLISPRVAALPRAS